MKRFESGALSSESAPRYDLIPLASIQRQAARMAHGAATHGERNYRQGALDEAFIRDRINHLIGHALAYAAGDRNDDHLGAVLANAGMLADLEAIRDSGIMNELHTVDVPPCSTRTAAEIMKNPPTLVHDERFSHAEPATCGCAVVVYPPGDCLSCQQRALRGST